MLGTRINHTYWVWVQVVEEGMGRRGEAVHPLRPVLHRTLADVQERLTFRAQAFIKVSAHPLPSALPACRTGQRTRPVVQLQIVWRDCAAQAS